MNTPQHLNTSAPLLPGSKAPLRVLITGGCGFIGRNLIAYLLKDASGTTIRVLDNLSVGTKEDLSKVCKFVEKDSSCLSLTNENSSAPLPLRSSSAILELVVGDIKDYNVCLGACEGIDIIVHLAANTGVGPSVENPRVDMEANVIGVFNMLEAAKHNKVRKFVFASSGAPVGECEPPIHEELAPHPVSPYGASKLAGEGYCSAYYKTFALQTVALRFGNVYGPLSGHKNSVVAKFIKQAMNGETLEIYGDGSQTRDFIYIDDLVQAILLAVKADVGGEVFQIATYKETTVNEIADAVKALIEKETDKKVNIIHGNHRLGDVKRNFSDISKAKRMLGFDPKYDLCAGLKNTFEYFKKRSGRYWGGVETNDQ